MDYISFRHHDYMYHYSKSEPTKLSTHYHNYYELIYILNGDLSYTVENSSYKVNAGDMFLTSPGELHTTSFNSSAMYERHFVQFSKGMLSAMEYNFVPRLSVRKPGQNNQIPAEIAKKYELDRLFPKIQYYIVNRLPESDVVIKAFIVQMIAAILNIYKFEAQILEQPRTSLLIAEIQQYISEHFLETLTLDDIAAKFYMNKYYLCHSFKNETGITIKEFINTHRIAHAKRLLPQCENVHQLYSRCGFNDYSTFYKTFKRFTGVSPKEFLK